MKTQPSDILATFAREIRTTWPNLTRAECADLSKRWLDHGDREAFNLLVRQALPWALKRAMYYAGRGLDDHAVIEVGCDAAMKAADAYRDERGSLSTLCTLLVFQLGSRMADNHGKLHRRERESDVAWTSLPSPPDETKQHAETLRRQKLLARRIANRLTDRERQVVNMRLDGHTLSSIGAALGVSKERVRQINLGAVGKLGPARRNPLAKRKQRKTPCGSC